MPLIPDDVSRPHPEGARLRRRPLIGYWGFAEGTACPLCVTSPVMDTVDALVTDFGISHSFSGLDVFEEVVRPVAQR